MPIFVQAIDMLRGRVLRLMRRKKTNQISVAKEMGLALGTFHQFFRGEKSNLTMDSLQKIESWCDAQETSGAEA